VSGRQDLIPVDEAGREPRLAAYFCQALVGAGRFVVISRFWVVALGLLAVVASCTSGSGAGSKAGGPAAIQPPMSTSSADRVCTPGACISLGRLAGSVATRLEGNVVGYVVLVGRSQAVASGLARTAADPPKLAMGPDVVVNVASVGKMFTTIAVLKSLARNHLSIDSRISRFLPPDWVQGPGVDTVTFRDLLAHRAGFRLDSGRVFETDDAAREQIRQGVQQVDKQVAVYNNINFTIFRDMLPFMEGALDPGPAGRSRNASRFFIAYLQRQVFDPVGVKDATCAPVRTAMLMYPPPLVGMAPGRQAPVGPSACSAGGWFMTPASMRRVLDGLISGNSLLSSSQRQQMDESCLGWDCSVDDQVNYRGKAGDFGDGSASLHIFFGILAGTIPVVVATNSDPLEGIPAILHTALSAATSPR
jgi:CubicO group peptidase (beta-lactamase class C family)